jgi:hypothetical protein
MIADGKGDRRKWRRGYRGLRGIQVRSSKNGHGCLVGIGLPAGFESC